MKLVLRIIGAVFAVIGCFILAAGGSAATDILGIIVLLVMGGLPLALGVFLIWKSMVSSGKKADPVAPDISSVPQSPKDEPAVTTDSIVPLQESVPPTPEPDTVSYRKYTFKVAGISRRQKDIADNLLPENSEYELSKKELVEIGSVDERIYKYDPIAYDAELVPEPTNPRDPNAIKVLVDNVHIGYVPADKTSKVKSLLEQKQIHAVSSAFYGGPYKIIHEDYDYDRGKDVYTIEKETQYNIGAEVTIEYK